VEKNDVSYNSISVMMLRCCCVVAT